MISPFSESKLTVKTIRTITTYGVRKITLAIATTISIRVKGKGYNSNENNGD